MHQLKKKMKKRNLTRRNYQINTYNSLEEINARLNQKNNKSSSLRNKEEMALRNKKNTLEKYNKEELTRENNNKFKSEKRSFEELEQFDKVKTRVLKYVFYKKRTAEEVRRKFESMYDVEILEDVIENLIELGYINDNSYIDRAVNEYMAIKDMSIREIKYKLLSKGLKGNIINEYFQKNYDILKEYEINSARKIVSKKSRTMDKIEIKGLLMRKGYSSDSIREVIG